MRDHYHVWMERPVFRLLLVDFSLQVEFIRVQTQVAASQRKVGFLLRRKIRKGDSHGSPIFRNDCQAEFRFYRTRAVEK